MNFQYIYFIVARYLTPFPTHIKCDRIHLNTHWLLKIILLPVSFKKFRYCLDLIKILVI